MSTHAAIIAKIGNQWHGIYCHSDGYLEWTGAILKTHYMGAQKVHDLIMLGDLALIGPCGKAQAYHRDRGEAYKSPATGTTWGKVACMIDHSGYIYVYQEDTDEPGVWVWMRATSDDGELGPYDLDLSLIHAANKQQPTIVQRDKYFAMNTMTVSDHTKQVASALVAISGTSKWGNLQAYIRKQTGGKTLTDYLNGDAKEEAKHADATVPARAPASEPKPVTPQLPPPLPPAAYTPAPTPPPAPVIQHVHVGDKDKVADPFAAMAAAILPHILPYIPAAEGGVTKDEARQMIREELAIVFAAIGKGVAK